jgi:hypothetical protein
MNGVIAISDGAGSFITDGIAVHDDVFFTNEIEATQGTTKLTQTEVITTDVICDDLTASTTNITTLTADTINTDRVIVYDASNNIITDLNGTNSTSTFNGVSNFNNTINVTNKNIVQTQTGEINQSGTGTNDFKDSNVNGFLVVGSNITQNGGSTSLKDVTCDTLTLRSGKSIIQSGTTSNSLSDTTVSNLIITTSVTFPSNVTVPGTTTTDDIIMLEDSIIDQSLLDEPSGKTNILRDTKTLNLEVDGDFDMSKGGSSATLKNTTIEGTAEIQGDITQTTGSTTLKTISCNNITLNADQNITQSGTGYITQSGTGFNLMKTIELTTNSNIKFYGTGILDQPYNTSVNVLNNTRVAGYEIVAGKNNSVAGNTQSCINNNGLQLQWNRDASSQYSFLMNNRSSGGNGGFRFQRYSTGNIIDEPLIIDDSITMNKNLSIPGGSLTCASASLGNISQTEINCLDNCSVNIQTQLNLLSDEIDNLQTSTSGNTTALTGISYNAGTDTTTIDNNLTVSAGKNLLVGTANVMNLIDLNADDIIALDQRTTGMSYIGAGTDRTTIDNNVTINKTLIVQGMDIKGEIDALDASITSGTLNTNDLVANNLTVTGGTILNGDVEIDGFFMANFPSYFDNTVFINDNNNLEIDGFVRYNNRVNLSVVGELTTSQTLTLPMNEYNVATGLSPITVTLPIGTRDFVTNFILTNLTGIMTIIPQAGVLIYDMSGNSISNINMRSTSYISVKLAYRDANWYILDFINQTLITSTAFITTGTITTANITTGNITTGNITTGNITTANVTNGSVGTANVTTGNIINGNITTLNVSSNTNLKSTNITTGFGQTSNTTLSVTDSKSGVDKSVIFVPNSNPGAYNPIVQTGDISIVGYGDTTGDGRLSLSTWSNTKNGVRITNEATTINGGDNFITVDTSSITIDSGNNSVNVDTIKTQVVGKFVSRALTPGYVYNGVNESFPILCSAKAYRPLDIDDYYYINPGFKFVIYQNDNYGVELFSLKNAGFSPLVLASTNANKMSSIKVYYSDTPTNDASFTEVIMDFIS